MKSKYHICGATLDNKYCPFHMDMDAPQKRLSDFVNLWEKHE